MRLPVLFVVLILVNLSAAFAQQRILVGAASDLKFALDSLVKEYNKTKPGLIDVAYGSSGKLTEQIINGAPFDLFFSADVAYPEQLSKADMVSSDIYQYAKGRIVVWSKETDPTIAGMNLLKSQDIRKIAVANPQHAPYGKRAVESLQYYELLDAIKSKLVYGENISQTAQFVSTGAADIGIIALSLALSPNMRRENGKYFLIPETSHQPLIQGLIITSKGRENKLAYDFFEFVKTEKAISILRHFGFERP